ncbi:hypothetical protein REPUB_Repub07fG0085100 [Reevesia pubescens]
MKVVWRLSKEVTILSLDSNLFLFKFATLAYTKKIIEGSPWYFDKNILLFKEFD